MNGANYPLQIDVGLPLAAPMRLDQDTNGTPVNLAGCAFEAFIRPQADATPRLALTVTITDAPAGKILISATAEETAALGGNNAWNLIMTDAGGIRFVLLRGTVELNPVIL